MAGAVMDSDLALLSFLILAFAVALDLFLTLRLAGRVRELSAPPLTAPIGAPVPPFEGIANGRPFRSSDLAGRPSALVFLSPGCKACAGKIGELVDLLPGAERSGVALWIVPADDFYDISVLVGGTPLDRHLLVLDATARLRLNPLTTAPFYLFVDEALVVLASNRLGDENWRTFVGDLKAAA